MAHVIPGFNEAAARCRGKRQRPLKPVRGRRASMRPRPDAAENAQAARGFSRTMSLQ